MRRRAPHPYIETLKSLLVARRIDRRTFLRQATLLGLNAVAAYAVVEQMDGTAVSQPAESPLPRGGRLRIAMRVPDLSHPHNYAWLEPEIARQVVPTLTKTGSDNITRPYLLEAWEPSDDLRSWTLHLRPGLRWRKGNRLTAEQVAWNLRRVLDSSLNSPVLGLMAPYMLDMIDTSRLDETGAPIRERGLWDANAIEVIDGLTLRINTRLPQVALPQHLQHGALGILDPEEGGQFGPGSNGLGCFELVEMVPGRNALLRAVSDHWSGHGPYLDSVEFIDFGADPEPSIAALAERRVEGIYRVELGNLGRLAAISHVRVYETQSAATAVARMKVTEPPFTDPRVRKALRLAIDCERVRAAALGTHGMAAEHHHVCPIQPDYSALPPMTRDVDAAKALLAEAGLPDGFKCQILVKDDPGWELAAVEEMQAQWKDAGIRVRIRKVSWNLYWELWNKVPFGFTNWAHDSLGTINLAAAYRGGAPWNESGYANREFDRLLALAEATLDLDARRRTMGEIEKLMQEDGPIVQPVWAPVFAAYDRKVKGFDLYPSRSLYAEEVALES